MKCLRPAAWGLLVSCVALASCGDGSSSTSGIDGGATPPPASPESPAPVPGSAPAPAPAPATALDKVISDMSLAHEAVPEGLSGTLPWAAQPIVLTAQPPAGTQAVGGFGQLFVAGGGPVPANTAVELRNFETYAQQNGQWVRLQYSEKVAGAFYPVAGYPAGAAAPAGTAGEVVIDTNGYTRVVPQAGMVYRFWPQSGVASSLLKTQAFNSVFTTVQARVVIMDGGAADNRSTARFLVNTAADWWQQAVNPLGNFSGNALVGQGRLRLVGANWDAHYFASAGTALTQDSSPPLAAGAETGATRATRIMVLGDSISQGSDMDGAAGKHQDSYRRPLWNLIVSDANHYRIDFVGTRHGLATAQSGCNLLNAPAPADGTPRVYEYDPDHQAYWAWCIEPVTEAVKAVTGFDIPDVVLLHLGTNDVETGGATGEQVTQRLQTLIGVLRGLNPNVRVLLSTLIPNAGAGVRIGAVNALIRTWVPTVSTTASPVTLVEGGTAVAAADLLDDGTHPGDAGEVKLANAFAERLLPLLKTLQP